MDTERWRQLQEWFAAARGLPAAARDELLRDLADEDADLAAHVRALLTADASTGVMDLISPQLTSLAQVLDAPATPARIGAYRIIGELGRGGMGAVYLAERIGADFEHRVAIKLIGTSDEGDPLHQRFVAERRILAGLTHPNIARLLDGGVTSDRRPYLVMEYVDGLPITSYCAERRLEVTARLRLFADVCAAVQHAHQNLVIHRDLKPSNILVSADGRVHLLDFGIAKLIDPAAAATAPTRLDARMMTPEYASPEQMRGETLGTTSDIYSLGVLLYELLCGAAPYDLGGRSAGEVAAIVCEQDPPPPSARVAATDRRLAQRLAGDLDGIVLMAMRKEPARRYASADVLRHDIERHLAGLPVQAHRGGRRYRIGRFLRRHRLEAAATAMVIVALVAGLSVAVTQGQRAARERDRAEQALAESRSVTEFLLELFRSADPGDLPAGELTALDLLQRGAVRTEDLANQPLVQARLLDVIGQMAYHLGRLDEARSRLEQAIAIHRGAGASAENLASSLIHLAWVHRTRNEQDRARALAGEALELRRASLPPTHPDVADALYELGWVWFGREQERLYRDALAILQAVPAAAERRITILQALATNLRRQGRLTEAIAAGREALALSIASFGRQHHTTGDAMIHLGDHVNDIEADEAGAEALYRGGLSLIERRFGDRSLRLLHGLNSLGRVLSNRGSAEAESHYRRALAISRAATGPGHPRIADQLHKLAGALARQDRLAEAESLAREALDLTIQAVGAKHQIVASSRLPLIAEILDRQRRYAEADHIYAAAFEQVGTSIVINGEMRRDYGLMLLRRDDLPGAERELLQSLASLERAYDNPRHPNVDETRRGLMALYARTGKPDLVERYRVPPGRFVPY